MNIKYLFFVCCVFGQVRSDCDGYIKCLGDFVHDFFTGDQNDTLRNDTVTSVDRRNSSVSFFDLSEIGKSLGDALTDVTALIKDELKGVFDVKHDIDAYQEIDNKTEIHVRAFSLNNLGFNGTETIKLPAIIMNNLTEFNDELNALKVELEKNLQAEIDDFISKIIENDTLDWEEVTDSPVSSEEVTTVQSNISTEQTKNENNLSTTAAPTTVTNLSTTTESIITTEAPIIKMIENNNYITTTIKISENFEIKDTTTGIDIINEITTVVPKETINNNVTEEVTIKTTTTSSTTPILSSTTVKEDIVTSTLKPEPTVKVEVIKPEAQTITPIDYKQLENIQENEISKEDVPYYDIQDDNATDYPIIDYVDLYKDTTNEAVDYIPTEAPIVEEKNDTDNIIGKEDAITTGPDNGAYTNDTSNPATIFSWVATIFIKNDTTNQFDYFCDGVLLSERIVLTAGRCVFRGNQTLNAEEVLVFLGKRSLQVNAGEERVFRVTQITLHENFTLVDNKADNDLAALHLEEPVEFSDRIQAACLLGGGEVEGAVTSAWDFGITLVHFVEQNVTCPKTVTENNLCATFGNEIPLCPSYGGAYAVKLEDSWCLRGIRTADPSYRGFCIEKTVTYTDLNKYRTWLDELLK